MQCDQAKAGSDASNSRVLSGGAPMRMHYQQWCWLRESLMGDDVTDPQRERLLKALTMAEYALAGSVISEAEELMMALKFLLVVLRDEQVPGVEVAPSDANKIRVVSEVLRFTSRMRGSVHGVALARFSAADVDGEKGKATRHAAQGSVAEWV